MDSDWNPLVDLVQKYFLDPCVWQWVSDIEAEQDRNFTMVNMFRILDQLGLTLCPVSVGNHGQGMWTMVPWLHVLEPWSGHGDHVPQSTCKH